MERLNRYGVKIISNAKVTEFLDDGVIYEKDSKEEKITGFDSVVLALGYRAYNPLESEIRDKVPAVHVIGDALKARKAIDAIAEGARVAITI
jgi:NADH dehydrogenase FAD-containing subunit